MAAAAVAAQEEGGAGAGGEDDDDVEDINIFLRDASATKGVHCRLGMDGVRRGGRVSFRFFFFGGQPEKRFCYGIKPSTKLILRAPVSKGTVLRADCGITKSCHLQPKHGMYTREKIKGKGHGFRWETGD